MSTIGHEIGRREFIVVSSWAVVAATASPKLLAVEPAGSTARLEIGYASSDENAVVAAASIPAGDGAFISRGARIELSGASGLSANPASHRAVELLVHYAYWDGAVQREVPFRAWGASRRTGCQGNLTAFTVPVHDRQKISLTLMLERGAATAGVPLTRRRVAAVSPPLASDAVSVTLSLTHEPSAISLVRGSYVLVPLFDSEAAPDWSSYTLKDEGGRWALADRQGAIAQFEHFVLRIDYAS